MGFMDSYKRLEKLCNEIMNNNKGITSYIEEMQNTPYGTSYVAGWNEDLKKLKHYRWVRNNIAHEPGCTEQDMCEPKDTLWINNFHSRIMNQTDPLALYYNATKKRTTNTSHKNRPNTEKYQKQTFTKKQFNNHIAISAFIAIALFIVFLLVFIYSLTQY